MLILGGMLLFDGIVVKMSQSRAAPTRQIEDMRVRDMIVFGIAQGIAALPGVSRSGATESALIFLNTKPDEAFRISFIAGIPVTLGASAVTLLLSPDKISTAVDVMTVLGIVIAIAVALVASLILIKRLIRFAGTSHITTIVFVLAAIAIAGGLITIISGFQG
jgi:undecaprenyl-diphosphatase